MSFKCKIQESAITYGPKDYEIDPIIALCIANELMEMGYRRTSNAYCSVARIDRDDWLDLLATKMRCCVADFYNKDGSGVGGHWKDHYVRMYSNDKQTVSPSIIRKIQAYF